MRWKSNLDAPGTADASFFAVLSYRPHNHVLIHLSPMSPMHFLPSYHSHASQHQGVSSNEKGHQSNSSTSSSVFLLSHLLVHMRRSLLVHEWTVIDEHRFILAGRLTSSLYKCLVPKHMNFQLMKKGFFSVRER